jgi:hypothetical protein
MKTPLNFALVGCGVIIVNDQIKVWQLRSGEKYDHPPEETHLIVGTTSANMMQAVWGDREPLCNGIEGRKLLEIVLAIYQSARTGNPVKLPLSNTG